MGKPAERVNSSANVADDEPPLKLSEKWSSFPTGLLPPAQSTAAAAASPRPESSETPPPPLLEHATVKTVGPIWQFSDNNPTDWFRVSREFRRQDEAGIRLNPGRYYMGHPDLTPAFEDFPFIQWPNRSDTEFVRL
jgi:hypothetical protein